MFVCGCVCVDVLEGVPEKWREQIYTSFKRSLAVQNQGYIYVYIYIGQ